MHRTLPKVVFIIKTLCQQETPTLFLSLSSVSRPRKLHVIACCEKCEEKAVVFALVFVFLFSSSPFLGVGHVD